MDLILHNARIQTMDQHMPQAEALAVKGGVIQKLGSNEEILSLATSSTNIINLSGRLVLPGFNDSHMHLLNYAYAKSKIDLGDAGSLEDVLETVRNVLQAETPVAGGWILGRGWCQNSWPVKDTPTRYDLDKVSLMHPIMLVRVCGHIAVLNTKALEVLGLLETIPGIEGGQVVTDEAGIPTGLLCEKALNLVYDALPAPSVDELMQLLVDAGQDALAKGITSVQTDDFESVPGRNYRNIITAYQRLANSGELPVRVYEQCLLPSLDRLEEFLAAGFRTGQGDDFFRLGPLKLLADGSLGARTALLCQPYADASEVYGISVFQQEQLDKLVETAHRNGLQVAIHCIGDQAMYMAFESYEKVLGLPSPISTDPRHSIIHCQITDPVLLEKYKQLDIIAHIQPIFLQSDLHMVDDRVGAARAETSYCWNTLHKNGVHVAHGSDCPVEKFDVLPGIYCAVTRRDLTGYPDTGWYPNECLSIYDAVKGFTLGAAYASFEDTKKGSLSEGKLADMVVLSEDIFEIAPLHIKDVRVLMTIVDGVVRYTSKDYNESTQH